MRYVTQLLILIVSVLTFGRVYAATANEGIRVTLLGTGTPYPASDRFGPAILVEAGGRRMLFDCGRGAVIRLAEAGMNPSDIDSLFLTHLHSDHVVGIPDLWLTGWLLGRKRPLSVWGPDGTRSMAQHLAEAFRFDVAIRESTQDLPEKGAEIDAKDIKEGLIYNKGSLRVTAFAVDHGRVPALGYRIDYSGHSVVISGDTKFSANLVHFAQGTDCLIHVAWSVDAANPTPGSRRSVATAEDAARVFEMVRPGLAVIYHYKDEEGMSNAIRAAYRGSFILARDLMTIEIGPTITWKRGNSSETVP